MGHGATGQHGQFAALHVERVVRRGRVDAAIQGMEVYHVLVTDWNTGFVIFETVQVTALPFSLH